MKLIAGLGNPGPRYARTRHNVGFLAVDGLARLWDMELSEYSARFEAMIGRTERGDDSVMLIKPQTFMNLSGKSVLAVRQFYKIEARGILVVYDDLDLPPGKLRLRAGGSGGGHNGMNDILRRLGTNEIARIRIGIGRVHSAATTSHVLGRFAPDEFDDVQCTIDAATEAAACWVASGITTAMNKYNRPSKTNDAGGENQGESS